MLRVLVNNYTCSFFFFSVIGLRFCFYEGRSKSFSYKCVMCVPLSINIIAPFLKKKKYDMQRIFATCKEIKQRENVYHRLFDEKCANNIRNFV